MCLTFLKLTKSNIRSLVEERDNLTRMFGDTQLGRLATEFVEIAGCYKTKVKAFYMNVQVCVRVVGA